MVVQRPRTESVYIEDQVLYNMVCGSNEKFAAEPQASGRVSDRGGGGIKIDDRVPTLARVDQLLRAEEGSKVDPPGAGSAVTGFCAGCGRYTRNGVMVDVPMKRDDTGSRYTQKRLFCSAHVKSRIGGKL